MNSRQKAKLEAMNRTRRVIPSRQDETGRYKRTSEILGENVFNVLTANEIPDGVKKEIKDVISRKEKHLSKESAEIVAKTVTEWAVSRGATHFTHWFQPLNGTTAEKHDAFLCYDKDMNPIENLSASKLMQGEPDASSFPNGGSRSTFEARGYTSWDLSSPMFLMESGGSYTLSIPTAFVTYTGEALDIKTPLLRSVTKLSDAVTKFLNVTGSPEVKSVQVTCGAEQEYFLVDKAFYYQRPDLVMTGRTLFGSMTSKNQQLDDHYFGVISERVICFMDELDYELHKLGVPAATRHNEVAPGQFELAAIFQDANLAADQNQIVMATIKDVAEKHDFVALLHEKPFAGINGSGKHMNWSMADDQGRNLLEPGKEPHQNERFLAFVSMITEAVYRHGDAIRMAIATHSNDHRLGANEAPPSIISVYLGDTIDRIFGAINKGEKFTPEGIASIDMGADQLVNLLKDNTDRNRTSPFAFTGNKFEVRAVGSSQAIGYPMSILNAAVASVVEESTKIIEKDVASGKSVSDAVNALIKKWVDNAKPVVFNGDGYSEEWVEEAEKRGLPNLRTSAEALKIMTDSKKMSFLTNTGVFKESELTTRYNVLIERYNLLREIEFDTLNNMVHQSIIPSILNYKSQLSEIIQRQKEIGLESSVELELYKKLNFVSETLFAANNNLVNGVKNLSGTDQEVAEKIAHELLPLSEQIANTIGEAEDIIPDEYWNLPKYFDMLFIR